MLVKMVDLVFFSYSHSEILQKKITSFKNNSDSLEMAWNVDSQTQKIEMKICVIESNLLKN